LGRLLALPEGVRGLVTRAHAAFDKLLCLCNLVARVAADLRACLVKVRVNLFVGLGYAEDLILMTFFGRNTSKTEEATPKNSTH
jgi:hypothetical protein